MIREICKMLIMFAGWDLYDTALVPMLAACNLHDETLAQHLSQSVPGIPGRFYRSTRLRNITYSVDRSRGV